MRVVDHGLAHGAASTPDLGRPVVAIGSFDGLHRGHQALFDAVKAAARQRQVPAGVLTFAPHPLRVLAPERAPPLILTAAEKEDALRAFNMNLLVIEPFTEALASLSPDVFIDTLLLRGLNVSGVVVGHDFRYGHRATGRAADLKAALEKHGVFVEIIEPVVVEDVVCSSTVIRQAVRGGSLSTASRMLGRPYRLCGTVVHGDGRGHGLGFPTANVATARELLPGPGVYPAWARFDGERARAVVNIGTQPTFGPDGSTRIEAHLLESGRDLYGTRMELTLLDRMRPEMRFDGIDALRAQIARDCDTARGLLDAGAAG